MMCRMSDVGVRLGSSEVCWAEIKSGDQHLRVLAQIYSESYIVSVFDEKRKQKVAQDVVDDLNEGKKLAEEMAARYLRYRGTSTFPKLEWRLTVPFKAAS
jgi:hypothetical protein